MGLFGLGSFGEGFVKGFATEANEALKDDIKRINTRVEKVADFQVQKSIKEQDKRKDELEDIEDAIAEGEGLFGTGPEATQYAAALLKQQGSISAYRSMIQTMKNRSLTTGESDFRSYMTSTGEITPPTATDTKKVVPTREQFAADFLGKPKATKPYDLPADAASAGAGNLISSLGFNVDMSKRIKDTVQQDLAARGLLDTDTTVPVNIIPSYTFDSESFAADGMDTQQKLKFYNDKLADPKNKDRVPFIQNKIKGIEGAILQNGGIDDQITVLKSQRGKLTDVKAISSINERIKELNRTKTLNEANASGDTISILQAKASIALSDAYAADPKNPDLTEHRSLSRQIKDITTAPTFSELNSREQDDFLQDVANGDLVQGTPEYANRRASLDAKLKIQELLPTNTKIDASETSRYMKIIEETSLTFVGRAMDANDYKIFYDAKAKIDKNPSIYASMGEDVRKIYDDGMALVSKYSRQAAVNVLSPLNDDGGFKRYPEAFIAASNMGYPDLLSDAKSVSTTPTTSTDTSEATSATTQTDAALTSQEPVVVSDNKRNAMLSAYPDTESGAEKLVANKISKGFTAADLLKDPEVNAVYGPAFKDKLKSLSEGGIDFTAADAETDMSQDGIVSAEATERNSKVDAIVDRFHNPTFSKTVIGQKSKVNRLIRESLGLENTPENKELVSKLMTESAVRLSPDVVVQKRGSGRGRSGRAKGGLMARN